MIRFSLLFLSILYFLSLCITVTSQSKCPDGIQPVNCFADPCSVSNTCSSTSLCRPNYCGGCNIECQCQNDNDCKNDEKCLLLDNDEVMICRIPTTGSSQQNQCNPSCNENSYCSSDNTCIEDGKCSSQYDCYSYENNWIHPFCTGFAQCSQGQCQWECSVESQVGVDKLCDKQNQCEEGLTCWNGEVTDGEGLCKQKCGDKQACPDGSYCSSSNVCLSSTICGSDSDCNNTNNIWPHILCTGSASCTTQRCNWNCGSEEQNTSTTTPIGSDETIPTTGSQQQQQSSDNDSNTSGETGVITTPIESTGGNGNIDNSDICSDGSTPVNCFADPCTTSSNTCKNSDLCQSNYCGGCNTYCSCKTDEDCNENEKCITDDEGSICVVARQLGESCSATLPCAADLYCSSISICSPIGDCTSVNDCNLSDNLWFHPECIGSASCNDNKCGWSCDTDNSSGIPTTSSLIDSSTGQSIPTGAESGNDPGTLDPVTIPNENSQATSLRINQIVFVLVIVIGIFVLQL